jgi:hypothetical protein
MMLFFSFDIAVLVMVSSDVLFQVYHDSPDGSRMETYYRLGNYPAIFVVDPRTGEFIVSFSRVQDAVSFCDQGQHRVPLRFCSFSSLKHASFFYIFTLRSINIIAQISEAIVRLQFLLKLAKS